MSSVLRRRLSRIEDPRSDEGFTLPEMLVSAVLFSFILGLAATMFFVAVNVQTTIQNVSSATVDAQLAAQSIDRGVRNAVGLELTGGAGAPVLMDPDDLMLVGEIATGTGGPDEITYNCQAWYYDASAGEIRWWATSLVEITAPTATQLAGWAILADRVTELLPRSVFTHTGVTVDVAFETTVEENSPIAIEFTTASMSGSPRDESSSTCF